MEKSGANIKKWADSFNKDILALKLDTNVIEDFFKKIKTTIKTLNSINFEIIKSTPPVAIVNALYGKNKNYFKGITHYLSSLGKIVEYKDLKIQDINTATASIKQTSGNLASAMTAMIVGKPLSVLVNKFYGDGRRSYFKGITNWLKSAAKMGETASKVKTGEISKSVGTVNSIAKSINEIQKTIAKNITAGIILALKVNMMTFAGIKTWLWKVKFAMAGISAKTAATMQTKVKAVADIAKSIKQISVDILLSYIPMKILNKLFPNAKTNIFDGIINWAKALDEHVIQNRDFPNAAKSMRVAASMKACAAVAKSVSSFAFAALKMSISLMIVGGVIQALEGKVVKSLDSLVNITNSIGNLTDNMQKLKIGKVIQATATTLLLIPYFVALQAAFIPMMFATISAKLINKLKPDEAFTMLTKALSTMLTRLSNLKKELGWGILTLGLLIVFSTLLLTATLLLTLALPLTLTASLGLVMAGVMFLALWGISKIATKCLKGILAVIACSIALAVMGIGLYVAVKALAKVSDIIMSTGPQILLSLAAMVVLFGLVIALGFVAPYAMMGAAAIAVVGIALAVASLSLLVSVMAMAKVAEIVTSNFTTLLKGFGELALVFGAFALAGAASILAVATLPIMLTCAILLLPTALALNVAITKLAEMPATDGLATKVLGLSTVFLALVPASAAAVAGAAAALVMKVSLFLIGDTMVDAFEVVQEASNAAKNVDTRALSAGVKAIQTLTDNMRSFDFSILKKKFKEIDKGFSAAPSAKDTKKFSNMMGNLKGDVIAKGLAAISMITKVMTSLDFSSLKSQFKSFKKGIKEAPSAKDMKKFADAIGALGTVDMNSVANFTSSFNAQFKSLTESKAVIDDLSASIHSLSAELKDISKQKDAVKILKDIKSNSGSASGFVSDIKAKLAGASGGKAQATSSGKTVDDLYQLLSQINDKIEEKKKPSWNS